MAERIDNHLSVFSELLILVCFALKHKLFLLEREYNIFDLHSTCHRYMHLALDPARPFAKQNIYYSEHFYIAVMSPVTGLYSCDGLRGERV